MKNMTNKDERMKIMNEVLNGIKVSDRVQVAPSQQCAMLTITLTLPSMVLYYQTLHDLG